MPENSVVIRIEREQFERYHEALRGSAIGAEARRNIRPDALCFGIRSRCGARYRRWRPLSRQRSASLIAIYHFALPQLPSEDEL